MVVSLNPTLENVVTASAKPALPYISASQPHNAIVLVDHAQYYIGKELIGKPITLKVEAKSGQFVIYHQLKELKRLEIR